MNKKNKIMFFLGFIIYCVSLIITTHINFQAFLCTVCASLGIAMFEGAIMDRDSNSYD